MGRLAPDRRAVPGTEARQHWFGAASNGLWEVVGQLSHTGIDVARLGRAKPGEKRASKGRQPTRIGRVVTAAPGPNCTCSYLVALRAACSPNSLYLAIHLGLHRTAVMHPGARIYKRTFDLSQGLKSRSIEICPVNGQEIPVSLFPAFALYEAPAPRLCRSSGV